MRANVLMTGATGMIGSLVLQHCLESPKIAKVTSLLRRKSGITHGKLNEIVVEDFMNLDAGAPYFDEVDIVYYCQGVYTGTVDRGAFRQITVDYPEKLGQILRKRSPSLRFCLLSGAGADRSERSRVMFAKDKGAIENRLSRMGFKSIHAFRPGYIYPFTPRQEPNISYRVTRVLYPLIKLLGSKYSIRSTELAIAMFAVGLNGSPLEILENKDILESL